MMIAFRCCILKVFPALVLPVYNRHPPLSIKRPRFTTGTRRCHSSGSGSQQASAVVNQAAPVYNRHPPLLIQRSRFTTGIRRCQSSGPDSQQAPAVIIPAAPVHNKNEFPLQTVPNTIPVTAILVSVSNNETFQK